MNWRSRFLLLFVEYRDALDRAQRAEDETQLLRGIAEEANKQLALAQRDALAREREITDRMMRVRHGNRVLSPENIAEAVASAAEKAPRSAEQETAKQWVRHQTANAFRALEEYESKLSDSRTN